jgi:hypothetical protein
MACSSRELGNSSQRLLISEPFRTFEHIRTTMTTNNSVHVGSLSFALVASCKSLSFDQ